MLCKYNIATKKMFEFLYFVAMLHFLLEEDDGCMMTVKEYLDIYEQPYDIVLDSGKLPVIFNSHNGTIIHDLFSFQVFGGHHGRIRMVVGFTATYAILSVPITINIVSSNPAQTRCTRYNIM
jgi:hypothetical protein